MPWRIRAYGAIHLVMLRQSRHIEEVASCVAVNEGAVGIWCSEVHVRHRSEPAWEWMSQVLGPGNLLSTRLVGSDMTLFARASVRLASN